MQVFVISMLITSRTVWATHVNENIVISSVKNLHANAHDVTSSVYGSTYLKQKKTELRHVFFHINLPSQLRKFRLDRSCCASCIQMEAL
jgi:hypothetical protein